MAHIALGELGGLPGAQKALSASRCAVDRTTLHADEEAVGEVAFEFDVAASKKLAKLAKWAKTAKS